MYTLTSLGSWREASDELDKKARSLREACRVLERRATEVRRHSASLLDSARRLPSRLWNEEKTTNDMWDSLYEYHRVQAQAYATLAERLTSEHARLATVTDSVERSSASLKEKGANAEKELREAQMRLGEACERHVKAAKAHDDSVAEEQGCEKAKRKSKLHEESQRLAAEAATTEQQLKSASDACKELEERHRSHTVPKLLAELERTMETRLNDMRSVFGAVSKAEHAYVRALYDCSVRYATTASLVSVGEDMEELCDKLRTRVSNPSLSGASSCASYSALDRPGSATPYCSSNASQVQAILTPACSPALPPLPAVQSTRSPCPSDTISEGAPRRFVLRRRSKDEKERQQLEKREREMEKERERAAARQLERERRDSTAAAAAPSAPSAAAPGAPRGGGGPVSKFRGLFRSRSTPKIHNLPPQPPLPQQQQQQQQAATVRLVPGAMASATPLQRFDVAKQLAERVLELGGARTEGIFRATTPLAEVDAAMAALERGELPATAPLCAAVLRRWLVTKMRDPIVPYAFYVSAVDKERDPMRVFRSIGEPNRSMLEYIVRFLQVLTSPENESRTKMTAASLAAVFAPCVMRSPERLSQVQAFTNGQKECRFLAALIRDVGNENTSSASASALATSSASAAAAPARETAQATATQAARRMTDAAPEVPTGIVQPTAHFGYPLMQPERYVNVAEPTAALPRWAPLLGSPQMAHAAMALPQLTLDITPGITPVVVMPPLQEPLVFADDIIQ
eukprot:m51a1_g4892 hypothetical protein (746) ;mRNA; r:117460-120673